MPPPVKPAAAVVEEAKVSIVEVVGKGQTKATLQKVSMKGKVVDLVIEAALEMTFKNQHQQAIEATFVYRSEEAAVFGFEVEIGGRKIVGEAKEKREAADVYDDAISSGQRGFLLEHNKVDTAFTLSLGNLGAGDECKVSIKYVQEVGLDDEGNALVELPITRVVPEGGVDVRLEIEGEDVSKVVCLSEHKTEMKKEGKATVVTLDKGQKLQRELQLRVEYEEAGLPYPRVEEDGGTTAVSIAFVPRIKLDEMKGEEVRTEVIFLIDRSGSMAGSRLRQTKNALQTLLRSLPEGCLFDIVSFGTRHERLFGRAVPYDSKSFERASKAVDAFEATLGGTNILDPLRAILESETRDEYPRQVVVLTDGDVDNADKVIEATRKARAKNRVFSLGIGMDANPALIRGIAKAGNGAWEMVQGEMRIEPIVARMTERVLRPIIQDVTMDWGELESGLRFATPSHNEAVYAGMKLSQYAVLFENDKKVHKVRLKVKLSGGQERSYETEVDLSKSVEGQTTHRMAARSIVNDFEAKQCPKEWKKSDIVNLGKRERERKREKEL